MSHQLFTNSAILLIRRAHPYIPIPRPQCARSRRIGSREKGFSHASQISSHQNRALHRHRNRPRLPGRRPHVGFHPGQQVPGNVLAHFYTAHPVLHEGETRRKYLLNMWLSFICGLAWGLVAIGAIAALSPAGPVILDVIIDFLICAAIVFVHKGLLDRTPLNAVACVFLGFAETLGCLQIIPHRGRAAAPYELERNRHARHLHLGHSGHVRAFLGMRRSHRKIRHGQAPLPRGRKRARSLN